MKKYTLLTLFHLLNYISPGQNLIQNPDFELYTTCPTGISQVAYANSWFSTIFSPDFYNCNFTSFFYFPTTSLAYSGTGFTGFLSYADVNGSGEAIAQQLNQPLLPNTSYSLSFAAKRPYQGAYANNCAGVAVYGFTTDSMPTDTLDIHASQLPGAVLLCATLPIQDINWTMHQLNFNVVDTIKYIVFTIGQAPSCQQYIFLDSLNLIYTGTTSVNETNAVNQFSLSNNPSNGSFTISLPRGNSEIIICDMLGQVISRTTSTEERLNGHLDKSGIYFITVKTARGTSTRKLIIN